MNEEEPDGRMNFDAAVYFVQQQPGKAAFSAIPVFGERTEDAEQRADGARVFVLEADGAGSYQMHFVAGPFFANVFAANETILPADLPGMVRELRFMPTQFDEAWLTLQVQSLIQKLVQASGTAAPLMPDHASTPTVKAGPEAVFPISIIGGHGR